MQSLFKQAVEEPAWHFVQFSAAHNSYSPVLFTTTPALVSCEGPRAAVYLHVRFPCFLPSVCVSHASFCRARLLENPGYPQRDMQGGWPGTQ